MNKTSTKWRSCLSECMVKSRGMTPRGWQMTFTTPGPQITRPGLPPKICLRLITPNKAVSTLVIWKLRQLLSTNPITPASPKRSPHSHPNPLPTHTPLLKNNPLLRPQSSSPTTKSPKKSPASSNSSPLRKPPAVSSSHLVNCAATSTKPDI